MKLPIACLQIDVNKKVLLLLIYCFKYFRLFWEFFVCLCFVMHYFVSLLVL